MKNKDQKIKYGKHKGKSVFKIDITKLNNYL